MKQLIWILGIILLASCGGRQNDATMLQVGQPAPSFEATDKDGNTISLGALHQNGPVVLSFLRSFHCPYCRKHLTEITQNFETFQKANVTVVAVSQDDLEDVNEYWNEHKLPFTCIPDENETLKSKYYQQDSTLAPLPAVFVVDEKGILKLAHYADGMSDIPKAAQLLEAAGD